MERPSNISIALDPDELKEQAQELVGRMRFAAELRPRAAHELLHELRLHEIELRMQNEALRDALDALELARARYYELYEFAPIAYLSIGDSTRILEANRAAASLF